MTPAPVPAGVLRPSNSERWGNCYGSPELEARYPEDDGPEAREGTAAHFYATEAAEGRVHPVGTITPNGHPIDEAMLAGGQLFLDAIAAARADATPTAILRVESRVYAHASIHPRVEGTPDAFLLDGAGRYVHVLDYKYGFGRVDPFRLWQLVCYLAGIWEGAGYSREDVASWRVVFTIVQPRDYSPAGAVKHWHTTGAEVWDVIADLAARAHRAADPNAPTVTGPWCSHCKARAGCDTLRRAGGLAMAVAGQATVAHMPPEYIGFQLKLIERAKALLDAQETGLVQEAMAYIRSGVPVPGKTLGHADTKERWDRPASEVLAMGKLLGVDLAEATKPISPFQARAVLKKAGIDGAVISSYRTRPTGAAKLVSVDDNTAVRAFGAAPQPPQEH